MTFCAIWYHLSHLCHFIKNVKITHGGVLLLVKLQALVSHVFNVNLEDIFTEVILVYTLMTLNRYLPTRSRGIYNPAKRLGWRFCENS